MIGQLTKLNREIETVLCGITVTLIVNIIHLYP